VNGTLGQSHKEPPTPARRQNLAIRYVGLVIPFVLTAFVPIFSIDSMAVFLVFLSLGAAVWLTASGVLASRRDWKGALAISAVCVGLQVWA
jgi:hypothetical protein